MPFPVSALPVSGTMGLISANSPPPRLSLPAHNNDHIDQMGVSTPYVATKIRKKILIATRSLIFKVIHHLLEFV